MVFLGAILTVAVAAARRVYEELRKVRAMFEHEVGVSTFGKVPDQINIFNMKSYIKITSPCCG
jgi:hypothetical protein